jgi:hypothetical protein
MTCEHRDNKICRYLTDVKKMQVFIPESFCLNVCKGEPEKLVKAKSAPTQAPVKSEPPYKQLGIIDNAKHFASAMKRFAKDGFKTVDERTFSERAVCCTTCTEKGRCIYCGCSLKYKSKLNSEIGCPNPQTYPNIPQYPPRDYWSVCKEKVSVLISYKDEPVGYLESTIKSLKENSTGSIEILVEEDTGLGRRATLNKLAQKATGDYLFIVDSHCTLSYGWDTKLKCACLPNTIAVSMIQALNTDFTYKNEKVYGYTRMTPEFEAKWCDAYKKDSTELITEVMSFTGCGWMIHKTDYISYGGYDEMLGSWGFEGEEWSFKISCNLGKILLRKDVICGHIFGVHKSYQTISRKVFKQKMEMQYKKKLEEYFSKWNDVNNQYN